jgi:hypothetical protein
MMKWKIISVALVVSLVFFSGCATTSEEHKGAAVGAGAGAAAGAIAGALTGHGATGAIVGGVIGGGLEAQ